LQTAGARTILVLNLNEYARLVGPNDMLPAADVNVVAEARTYGAAIWSSLTAAGVNFVPVDINSLFTYVSRNPTRFGFTAQTVLGASPACNSQVSSGILCTRTDLVNAERRADPFVGGWRSPDRGGPGHRGRLHLQFAYRAE
jgi:outer membrane lipase/esterase